MWNGIQNSLNSAEKNITARLYLGTTNWCLKLFYNWHHAISQMEFSVERKGIYRTAQNLTRTSLGFCTWDEAALAIETGRWDTGEHPCIKGSWLMAGLIWTSSVSWSQRPDHTDHTVGAADPALPSGWKEGLFNSALLTSTAGCKFGCHNIRKT